MSCQFKPASYSKVIKMDYTCKATWEMSYHRYIVEYYRPAPAQLYRRCSMHFKHSWVCASLLTVFRLVHTWMYWNLKQNCNKKCKALAVPLFLNGTRNAEQFFCDCHDKTQENQSKTSNYKNCLARCENLVHEIFGTFLERRETHSKWMVPLQKSAKKVTS